LPRPTPSWRAEVFDQPAVLAIAERHIREAGLEDRVSTRVGDLRTDEFGGGYDLVLISAICHMLSEGREFENLLARVYRALAPAAASRFRISWPARATRRGPRAAALFSLNMPRKHARGASYSEDEYTPVAARGPASARCGRIPLPGPPACLWGRC